MEKGPEKIQIHYTLHQSISLYPSSHTKCYLSLYILFLNTKGKIGDLPKRMILAKPIKINWGYLILAKCSKESMGEMSPKF
jgi:hypothetical protein